MQGITLTNLLLQVFKSIIVSFPLQISKNLARGPSWINFLVLMLK
jgi:hypothetical protein